MLSNAILKHYGKRHPVLRGSAMRMVFLFLEPCVRSGLERETCLLRPFILWKRFLRTTRISPRNVDFSRYRDRLDAKPRRSENMPVSPEATLQSRPSAPMVYEIDIRRSYNN